VKILIVSSEMVPFAKTGGLADVAGALPQALRALGHDVRAILPRYREMDAKRFAVQPATPAFVVPVGNPPQTVQLVRTTFPGTEMIVYAVEHAPSFDRDGLYQVQGQDHPDNLERFTLFCRAVLDGIQRLDWRPDVIHANDWQTALLATYLKTVYRDDPAWRDTAVVFTIHNLAYQGLFPQAGLQTMGLGDDQWSAERLEFYGRLNLLKAGLLDSECLTTVSPTYAQEIQTPALGCGLDGLLRKRREVLSGILNGLDIETWNPASDPLLPARFTADDLTGKATCKTTLQRECHLPVDAQVPLFGMISRLVEQKGADLLVAALPPLFRQGAAQCVVLGTGDPTYHQQLEALQRQYPDRVHVALTFDNRFAHLIEAGADGFVMPSRYEPCGLNQMYSLRYGTIPVARKTGGLADTIVAATEATLRAGTANGFLFEAATASAFVRALRQAVALFRDRAQWQQLMRRGMQQDFSWTRSARAYVDVYRRALQTRRAVAQRT